MDGEIDKRDGERKTMKILVTGASGYIGRHVVKELLNHGHSVLASDIVNNGIDNRAEFTDIPIFSGKSGLYREFGFPDALIHMAWRNGFVHNATSHMEDLSAHITFLYRMMEEGLPVLSVMGSMHEVGYWEGAITADTPCNPLSLYGVSKNALRQALQLYVKTTASSLRWLRAYYIYGDDRNGASIFAKIIQAAQDNKKTFPFTTGKNQYDFISVSELAEQITYATLQNEFDGVINVCTGKPVSLAEQVEWFIKVNNFDIRLEYGVFPDRPYDSPGVWGNAEIINKILNKKIIKDNAIY